jgi:PEP-CTERM motif
MFNMKFQHLAAAALMAATVSAQATSIVAPSATFSGTAVYDFNFDDAYLATFPSLNITGPLSLGGGVTLTSSPFVEIGANVRDLEDNGAWTVVGNSNRDGYFIATNFVARRGEFGFSFDAPIQKVGIFANQLQPYGKTNNSIEVLAYDQYGSVLESFNVTINTAWDSYDEGMFIGFQRASADIYGFGIANGSFVVDNLTVAVPEPETYALVFAGLAVVGALARRRAA